MENRLDGLPKYGVTLSGSPENPVIENRSGRAIIPCSRQRTRMVTGLVL